MKVAFLQDMNPLSSDGGAQLNDRAMIMYGLSLGHDIAVISASNPENIARPDVVIISNSMTLKTSFYDEMMQNKIPYVFFVHDYGPQVCRWRLFYPMLKRCKTICYLRDRWTPYLAEAKHFIWLSKLHRKAWLFAYPWLADSPYSIIPSAINEKEFIDLGGKRDGIIAVASGQVFKGWPIVKMWATMHPEEHITLVDEAPPDAPPNVQAIGYQPYAQMCALYNQHEYFLHLPDRYSPFDRTVIEARLSGCKLLLNSNVGSLALARKPIEEIRSNLRHAPKHFWQAVEKAVTA